MAKRWIAWIAAVIWIGGASWTLAEESNASTSEGKEAKVNFKYQTVTTPEGLTFRVPEDMPIEVRGGIQAPIPFDEYTYGKFQMIDKRLASIDSKLEEIRKSLAEIKAAAAKKSQLAASN